MNEQTELEIKEKLAREEFRLRSLSEAELKHTLNQYKPV